MTMKYVRLVISIIALLVSLAALYKAYDNKRKAKEIESKAERTRSDLERLELLKAHQWYLYNNRRNFETLKDSASKAYYAKEIDFRERKIKEIIEEMHLK